MTGAVSNFKEKAAEKIHDPNNQKLIHISHPIKILIKKKKERKHELIRSRQDIK